MIKTKVPFLEGRLFSS